MKRIFLAATLFVATAAFGQFVIEDRFQLPATQSLFNRIQSSPGFNLSKPATFGYFFISSDPAHLQLIRKQLEAEGYSFVETHVDAKGRSWLQMSKTEVHTPESMVQRNGNLLAIARSDGQVEYDGWDITRNAP